MQPDMDLMRRVTELEQRLDWLYQQTGYGSPYPQQAGQAIVDGHPSSVSMAVLEMAQSGAKIKAIKQFRLETGADLRTAKKIIDSLG